MYMRLDTSSVITNFLVLILTRVGQIYTNIFFLEPITTMRVVIQKVKEASVTVDKKVISR